MAHIWELTCIVVLVFSVCVVAIEKGMVTIEFVCCAFFRSSVRRQPCLEVSNGLLAVLAVFAVCWSGVLLPIHLLSSYNSFVICGFYLAVAVVFWSINGGILEFYSLFATTNS